MRRSLTGTILWSLLAACVGIGLFVVKYEVKDLEARLNGLNAEIHRNQETIHVLRAEWSYLNDPIRLRALSEKHLGMRPMMPSQVATLDTLPKDGIPATGPVYAAISPSKVSMPQPSSPLGKPPEPRTEIKTASPAKPTTAPPVLAKAPVQPQIPGQPQVLAPPGRPQAPTVKPLAPPPTLAQQAPATTPAKGGRSIVIQSPALAQSDQGEAR
ncbi:MAG: energy transducer TonB [Magnetospirillum sp.]|nr:energy transducer TonB [Magnetospirillum sp.]